MGRDGYRVNVVNLFDGEVLYNINGRRSSESIFVCLFTPGMYELPDDDVQTHVTTVHPGP